MQLSLVTISKTRPRMHPGRRRRMGRMMMLFRGCGEGAVAAVGMKELWAKAPDLVEDGGIPELFHQLVDSLAPPRHVLRRGGAGRGREVLESIDRLLCAKVYECVSVLLNKRGRERDDVHLREGKVRVSRVVVLEQE